MDTRHTTTWGRGHDLRGSLRGFLTSHPYLVGASLTAVLTLLALARLGG